MVFVDRVLFLKCMNRGIVLLVFVKFLKICIEKMKCYVNKIFFINEIKEEKYLNKGYISMLFI